MNWLHQLILKGALALISGSLVAATPPKSVMAFIDQHCADCHDADAKKGGLDLYSLDFKLDDAEIFDKWRRVYDRVKNGEMPPRRDQRPEEKEMKDFLGQLEQPLVNADEVLLAETGRVNGRRLTRSEYENTMHDLLGIDIPLVELLPEDGTAYGFETVASAQQLSHHQMGRYLDAADQALEEAFERAFNGDKKFKQFFEPKKLGHDNVGNNRSPEYRDGRSLTWPMALQFTGRMPHAKVPDDGWYRVTLHGVEAVNPKNGVVWGTLRSGTCVSSTPILYSVGIVDAREEPRDLVFEAWIRSGHMLELKPNDSTLKRAPSGGKGGNVAYEGRMLEKQGFSGIANRGLTMERIYPVADDLEVRRRLFGTAKPLQEWENLDAKKLNQVVEKFARRAFRRPVSREQLALYQKLGQQVLDDKGTFQEALRASYRAILCSPRFLTFVEPPNEVDDHALASRLSYTFWVTMPDNELSRLADEGKLHDRKVLIAQVERLLEDPRSQRFIKSFTDQWLRLKEIDFTNPDPKLYPQFDLVLQEAMLEETRSYVTELINKDLPSSHLVDSDFTFLNERLARHYFGDLPKPRVKQVAMTPESSKSKSGSEAKNSEIGDQTKDLKKEQTTPKSKDKAASKSATKVNDPNNQSPTAQLKKIKENLSNKNEAIEEWHPLRVLDRKKGLQKVTLPAGTIRGGLLGQGSVLKVTADGTSTSPVLRGVFVNERLLGVHLPAPPPGVEAIEPDIRGASSIRAQLEKHRSSMTCATCHYTIDPPGFALESFDPVGVWRKRYGSSGKGVEIDASGTTPDGKEFKDFLAWKRIYSVRGEQLGRAFAEQFLIYATGAPIRFSERDDLEQIVSSTAERRYGLRSLLKAAILSDLYRKS